MSKDLDYLRERHKELVKERAEKHERDRLLNEIKQMEEEGTLKSKIRNAAKSLRSKLHEKGRKLKDDGDRLSGNNRKDTKSDGSWNPAIAGMARESEFKGPKAAEAKWEPAIAKMVKK